MLAVALLVSLVHALRASCGLKRGPCDEPLRSLLRQARHVGRNAVAAWDWPRAACAALLLGVLLLLLGSHGGAAAPAHKLVLATQGYVHGHDFACAEADGPDARACQIRCAAPCVEPFRLCLAQQKYVQRGPNPHSLSRASPADQEIDSSNLGAGAERLYSTVMSRSPR